jgi:ubiquinone/menaquinone biosynthesis C-methylase UbiE
MAAKAQVQALFDSLALEYVRTRERQVSFLAQKRLVIDMLGPVRGRILEVGCGNGQLAERLRDRRHDVVAVDVTMGSALATAERARCPVLLAGLPDLPFPDRAFDTVVCSHTLEHIPDLWRAAAELRRVAKRVVVVVPCQRYYRYTVDYHLHFFPTAAPLERLLGGTAHLVDGDWVVVSGS